MQFHVIGDENTVTGFRMIGLAGEIVESGEETREALREAFSADDIGIIIITERVAAQVQEEIDEYLFGHDFPLIIQIPDREGPIEGRVSIRDMVNAAIGVKT
ncbi:MAG: Vacuolar H+transporting two-sector ATPase F subunit [Candidatus Latescibacteria bacterium]|nr:Vacuolar H+transporting two-sector ATPase F subunit [bacterium]MBD3425547.1 Vacuolar H+transporting two-sector ATPase F subunit [Candidatus Latescibacterota bacterium]